MKKLLLLSCLISSASFGQKKIIDHTAYNDWKRLSNQQISNDGNFIAYEINPHRGDGYLYIYDVNTKELDSIPRGKNAKFTGGNGFLVFSISAGFDTLRNCELNDVKKEKWPKDSLGIFNLSTKKTEKIARVKSFQVNDESDVFVYFSFDNKKKETEGKKKKKRGKRKKKGKKEPTSDGKLMTVYGTSLETNCFQNVRKAWINEEGTAIAFTTHEKIDCDSVEWRFINVKKNKKYNFPKKFTDVSQIEFTEKGNHLAFVASSDSTKTKTYALQLFDTENFQSKTIADSTQSFLQDGHTFSNNYKVNFTKNGEHLYFGTAEKPITKEEKDTLLESEKVKLDLWHYQDKRLQPEQLLSLERDKKKTQLHIFHLKDGTIIPLSNDTLTVFSNKHLLGENLLARSVEKYQHTYNWVAPRPADYYLVSSKTGKSTLLKSEIKLSKSLSPAGKHFIYFNADQQEYFLVNLVSKQEKCITCSVDSVIWTADMNGMPMTASSLGVRGWKRGENIVYLQSKYDLWQYDISTDKLSSTTKRFGEKNNIKLSPRWWEYDSVYFDIKNVYFSGFNEKTKGQHFFKLKEHNNHIDWIEMSQHDAQIIDIRRSKNGKTHTIRSMTLQQYPEIQLANENFSGKEVVSTTNSNQGDFNWATVELINWKSYNETQLEGLLYKPENYDSTKSYPLLVYYYELNSDGLHRYFSPKPTASIIYPTEYASAGYFVFIPDIRYREGHPAQSAYDCIMSGTDKVLNLYPSIDSTRMGLQGQSWGGYQTAQLVTMTNRYKAAMAGAPVTNMFSAYGGIRWGSGLNRQFQYERTQSRIGYTIWEKPELYIENSPQFHLPKVTTPLLIMHNDNDGAVPWYQGIELFTGLKRLGKKAWMLNYNGDKHNLMKNANRMDLSIRMRQFFDYYLQGKSAPKWLKDGIPAIKKGKEMRYETEE